MLVSLPEVLYDKLPREGTQTGTTRSDGTEFSPHDKRLAHFHGGCTASLCGYKGYAIRSRGRAPRRAVKFRKVTKFSVASGRTANSGELNCRHSSPISLPLP